MTALSPQVSIQTYPSSDGEPVAETFVYAYARLKWGFLHNPSKRYIPHRDN